MSEHTPKRRRLEASDSDLRKPFKSPFRRSAVGIPSSSPPRSDTESLLRSAPSTDPIIPSSPLPPPTRQHPPNMRSQPSPEIVALQRKQTHLITQSRTIRAEFDTIKQAMTIEEADKDVELERLIEVWRSASQSAAEEIFATVKDKVNKMGGVFAWRKKEQDRKDRMEEWSRKGENEDDDDDDDDEDEDEDEEEREEGVDPEEQAKRDELRQAAREAKAAARETRKIAKLELAEQNEPQPAQKPVEEFPEDEPFTMDMMLKELKVDLDLIGFDAGCQKWVD